MSDLEQLIIGEEDILELCAFVDSRQDCSDFKLIALLKAMYGYRHLLGEQTIRRMKAAILNFKYGMDEPGEDSMCYWSENHQVLFAACEYLAGQLYPDERFPNADMTGAQHLDKARGKLLRWLKYRFQYGFTEFHSNVYYEADIASLAVLIDYAGDPEIVGKSKIIMDLLLLDMGMHAYSGLFAAASGRCYESSKKRPKEQHTREISEAVWGFGHCDRFERRLSLNFILMRRYDLPEVIRKIGRDRSEAIIKDSMGLDLKEIRGAFADLNDRETTGMFLWGMESFVNPESINMAMRIFRACQLERNAFLRDLKALSHPLLVKLGLLPLLVRLLNPVVQGTAIQRANTYTYKTKHYMLSTVQNYHPGTFGDQQHIWQATLSAEVGVFATHPAVSPFADRAKSISPGYWVGSGILPHAAQERNVHLSICKIDQRKGFMEKPRARYTHAYFPRAQFDETVLDHRYLFGRLAGAYIALIGKNELTVNPEDASDIIQQGRLTYWICELGSADEYDSLQSFMREIRARPISFARDTLRYHDLALTYKGDFTVKGEKADTQYGRFDTPYVKAGRSPEQLNISFAGSSLYVHFDRCERVHS